MNEIEAKESDYLYVQASQIKNSGKGLFTAINLYKGEIIALYSGKILTDKQIKNKVLKGKDKYFIHMLDGTILDSMSTFCFAKFANDAKGINKSIFKNNSKITLSEENKVCLLATRNIKAKKEIFCSYGKEYWKKLR